MFQHSSRVFLHILPSICHHQHICNIINLQTHFFLFLLQIVDQCGRRAVLVNFLFSSIFPLFYLVAVSLPRLRQWGSNFAFLVISSDPHGDFPWPTFSCQTYILMHLINHNSGNRNFYPFPFKWQRENKCRVKHCDPGPGYGEVT